MPRLSVVTSPSIDHHPRAPHTHTRWAGLAIGAVLALAAVLRFWALGRPDTLVFDELYYVRDAVSQLAHGFPTTWPDDDPEFGGERARAFSDIASTIAHPPLGKWLIGIGIALFGADTGWGWRSAVAAAGVATVAVTMRLGYLLTKNVWIACLAGLLLAIDGVHVVLTRLGLLDGFLTLFVALGALFVWKDLFPGSTRRQRALSWRRPWLLCAGVSFGAAAAVKWSGLYPLAAFLVLIVAVDVARRLRSRAPRPIAFGALQAVITAALALPAAALTYLATWAGWIASPTAQNREPGEPWWVSLAQWHADSLAWHSTLSAPHPFQSHPLTWPLGLRPTAMYETRWAQGENCPWPDGCVAAISPLPNLLVTWGGVAALLFLAWMVARRGWIALRARSLTPLAHPTVAAATFVLVGYLSGWLPWVLTFSRSAVFQFYAVVLTPFAALALALVFGALWAERTAPGTAARTSTGIATESVQVFTRAGIHIGSSADAVLSRRIAVSMVLTVAVALAVLFFPVWSGQPVAEWFFRAHLWLPGWE